MEPKDQYHRYSLTDIERYLQGRLSPAEMHAMEKAALQDPFLADALEGFSEADMITAKKDLDHIRKKLTTEEEHRIVPFIIRKTYTWRIAAAVIFIVAGVGSWVLFFNNRQSTQSLALNNDSVVVQKDSIKPAMAAIAKPDSAGIAAANTHAEIQSKKAVSALHEQERAEDLRNKEAALALREQSSKQNARDIPVKLSARSRYPAGTTFFEITGRVTDSLHQPVAAAIVENLDMKMRMTTDQNGEFKMYGVDSSVNRIRISAIGYNHVDTISAYNNKDLAILMKPLTSELNEVVAVQGFGKKSLPGNAPPEKLSNLKKDTLTYALSGKVAGVAVQPRKDATIRIRGASTFNTKDAADRDSITGLSAEPAGGWDSLKQNIRSIAKRGKLELPANFVKVTAGLTLNRRGSARKVDILYLSIESLKPAIVEALKAVPSWYLNGKKQTGPVVINFQF
ncbi:carboxypeptidase-like regulatory domain-containing protein [Sediminibacterium ginsengisoli]|uniref:CarboxypepD_reg-like domain-containing protein n=1 Tax=Sediminibacterium ginsengisoli TaxID=413434 RepID=A0A1T4LJR8_9BACT|nr:carboxypeptidase-like regulatory domain-containing protein [Sediminibacterium ginsengisoli]SJZ54993.1 CarboxypepD_reg-like domain-containing protein [Sediminibacterium ginsengisoli]